MRKFFLNALAFAAIASAVTLTSCSDDETGDNGGTPPPTGPTAQLSGPVSGTWTLDASTAYTLTGQLLVPDGAKLVIPAGTTIRATEGFNSYILV